MVLPDNYLTIGDFKLFHDNEAAAKSIIDGIFHKNYIPVKCTKNNPTIIDCGSHIGISILFFKMKYPESSIIAFEPNETAFSLLKKNIEVNNLHDVTLVKKAVHVENGVQPFFGEIHNKEADNRGNSLIARWGKQLESGNEQMLVSTTKLSSYIQHEIDFLKLDIEAAEQQVLEELGDKLKLISELSIEVHLSSQILETNSLEKILTILEDFNFEVNIVKHRISFISKSKANWFKKNKPSIFMLHAIKKTMV